MIEAGNGEHPDEIKSQGYTHGGPTTSREKHPETDQVQTHEGHDAKPVNTWPIVCPHLIKPGIGVEPASYGKQQA